MFPWTKVRHIVQNECLWKLIDIRLYDYTGYSGLFKRFRGNLIYPITTEKVLNIGVLEDFLYGCDEQFQVYGKFTQYLEDCNRTNPMLKKLYNELTFRIKDPIAMSFIKSQKQLSVNYSAKK